MSFVTDTVGALKQYGKVRRPPGPFGEIVMGNGPALLRDPLSLYLAAQKTYGNIVWFRAMPPFSWYMVTEPHDIEHVLVTRQKNYVKGDFFLRALKPILGRGLFTNEGESWLQQRRLIQPTFHRGHVTALADTILRPTAARLDAWEAIAASGEPIDMLDEMTRLTLQVAGLSMFGTDVSDEANEIARSARVVFAYASYRLNEPFPWPLAVPNARNQAFKRALHDLDSVVYAIIQRRRREGSERNDLLALLMNAQDADTGAKMSDLELRDEIVTLLLAGHETTAATLSWVWYLLALNPEAETTLHAELDSVLAGRAPTAEDVPNLPYTDHVIQEALRLYPPAWGMPRQAVEEDELSGYKIPPGAVLNLCTWVTHRRPDLWEHPERFDPDRFSPERSADRPRFTFLPFGGGARQCVGSSLALLESRLVLASAAQRYRARLVPGHPVIPDPTFTLRPRYGVRMTLHAR